MVHLLQIWPILSPSWVQQQKRRAGQWTLELVGSKVKKQGLVHNSIFCKSKELGILLLPPKWRSGLVHCYCAVFLKCSVVLDSITGVGSSKG